MGADASGLNDAVTGFVAARWIAAFTSSSAEVSGGSYARQQTTWGAASAAASTGSQVHVPIPAGTTVSHWAVFTAQSGGTRKGIWALSSPEAFGADGTLDLTPTITGTAVN